MVLNIDLSLMSLIKALIAERKLRLLVRFHTDEGAVGVK
jgi:hypothetical protein